MSTAFEFSETKRENVNNALGDIPLTTHVWRLLRTQHSNRAEQLRKENEVRDRDQKALAHIAEQVGRLHDLAHSASETEGPKIARIANALTEALTEAGVLFLAPTGEPYTDDLMDVLESVARISKAELSFPRIEEVIEPAIFVKGALVRMGKAVIAIPTWDEQSEPMAIEKQEYNEKKE